MKTLMYTLIAWEITNRSEQNGIGLLVNNQMGNKKAPVKVEGNLMFSQRNNPYCDLLSK